MKICLSFKYQIKKFMLLSLMFCLFLWFASGNVYAGHWKMVDLLADGIANYYVMDDGQLAKGWFQVDGNWYCANEEGEIAIDRVVDGRYVNEKGVWEPLTEAKDYSLLKGTWKYLIYGDPEQEIYITIGDEGAGNIKFNDKQLPCRLQWVSNDHLKLSCDSSIPLICDDTFSFVKDTLYIKEWADGEPAYCYRALTKYYVGSDGAMQSDTVTPDVYYVDSYGAWDGLSASSSALDINAVRGAYNEYLKKISYEQSMLQLNGKAYDPQYDIVFIDGDSIPELIYAVGPTAKDRVHVCTYKNGQVIECKSFGNNGVMYYAPGTGYIDGYSYSSGGHGYDAIFRLIDGSITEVCGGEILADAINDGKTEPSYGTCRINGVEVSKKEFLSYKKSIENNINYVTFEFKV